MAEKTGKHLDIVSICKGMEGLFPVFHDSGLSLIAKNPYVFWPERGSAGLF